MRQVASITIILIIIITSQPARPITRGHAECRQLPRPQHGSSPASQANDWRACGMQATTTLPTARVITSQHGVSVISQHSMPPRPASACLPLTPACLPDANTWQGRHTVSHRELRRGGGGAGQGGGGGCRQIAPHPHRQCAVSHPPHMACGMAGQARTSQVCVCVRACSAPALLL